MANPQKENWHDGIEIPLDKGVVYLIKCNDLLKVGITRDFNKRFKQYVTENPYELKVVGVFESDNIFLTEGMVKDYWNRQGFRFRGEWYRLPEEEIESVISYLT
jgi:hypothetical protein